MGQPTEFNPYGGDWLDVDTSQLPASQLPLLQSMIGRRLVNIQRSTMDELDWDWHRSSPRDFFRKATGKIILDMEGLPPVIFDDYKYYHHEFSLCVSTGPFQSGGEALGLVRRYTLFDGDYVDDRLAHLPGQRLLTMRILIRRPHLPRDTAQALQDGLEMTFENGTTLIISYYLSGVRQLEILYPEEVPWKAVEYIVDVARPRISWRYRFNRWKWRALDRLGRRLDLD